MRRVDPGGPACDVSRRYSNLRPASRPLDTEPGTALAGATFLLTDALDPLFPLAGAIGLWAVATGIALLRRTPTAEQATAAAAAA